MKVSIQLLIFLGVFAGKAYSNDIPAQQAVAEFYTDPGSNAYQWVGQGGSANAGIIRTHIAEQAGGKWYGTQHDQPWGVQPVGDYVSDAAAAGQIPILVAYNMYQRDCGGESNGGASSKQSYKAWIDDFAVAIGDRKALVILEPDALTQYLVCGNIDKPARQELLAYAVNALATKAINAQVYLDAGNAEWPGDASSIAAALRETGVEKIDGFALNVSNHYETYKSHDRAGTINYFLGTRAGYVIDTSRNGAGKTDTSEDSWCNPRGAMLGEHSRYTPEGPADAVLWVKVPGDSDGSCNYGEGIPAGQFSEKLAMALITGVYDE